MRGEKPGEKPKNGEKPSGELMSGEGGVGELIIVECPSGVSVLGVNKMSSSSQRDT